MIEKKMIIDPDHLSVRARNQVLDIVEKASYSGRRLQPHLEHARRDPAHLPRSAAFVTPYAGESKDFVEQWREAPGRCATRASTRASAGART